MKESKELHNKSNKDAPEHEGRQLEKMKKFSIFARTPSVSIRSEKYPYTDIRIRIRGG